MVEVGVEKIGYEGEDLEEYYTNLIIGGEIE